MAVRESTRIAEIKELLKQICFFYEDYNGNNMGTVTYSVFVYGIGQFSIDIYSTGNVTVGIIRIGMLRHKPFEIEECWHMNHPLDLEKINIGIEYIDVFDIHI